MTNPTSRRVFILGSGFSASMGLPTLVTLFREVMSQEERPGESDKENILNALEILYPHFCKDINGGVKVSYFRRCPSRPG